MNTIGSMIAERRKYLALTQKDLAQKIGVTQQAVCKWERDITKPDVWLLKSIGTVLGYTPEELLTETPKKQSKSLCHIYNSDTKTSFGIIGTDNAKEWIRKNKDKYIIKMINVNCIHYCKPAAGQKPHLIMP